MTSSVPFTGALFLLAALSLFRADDNGYALQEQECKTTMNDCVTARADLSAQQEELMKQYTGDKAADCKDQLSKQDYTAALQSKVTQIRSKVEYIDKTCHSTIQACSGDKTCEKLARGDAHRDLSALEEKANTAIDKLKSEILQKQKDFMDKCVS